MFFRSITPSHFSEYPIIVCLALSFISKQKQGKALSPHIVSAEVCTKSRFALKVFRASTEYTPPGHALGVLPFTSDIGISTILSLQC